MHIRTPLPLYHSWPLFNAAERMDVPMLRPVLRGAAPTPGAVAGIEGALAEQGIGVWECDLSNDRLTWTRGVYELFGLPRDQPLDRALTVSLYTNASRDVMLQLRRHAIRYRRGFTVDAQIRQPGGDERWMRLSAMPVLEEGRAVRLCGLKVDVTADYDVRHDRMQHQPRLRAAAP